MNKRKSGERFPVDILNGGKGIIVYFRRATQVATEKGLAQGWPSESCEQNVLMALKDDDEDTDKALPICEFCVCITVTKCQS